MKWCGSQTPEFTVANVPKETTQFDLQMMDLQVQTYRHGGGKVAYKGGKTIPCGSIPFSGSEGPSPPFPQVHDYQWTAKAMDASGRVLATATATRKFPER